MKLGPRHLVRITNTARPRCGSESPGTRTTTDGQLFQYCIQTYNGGRRAGSPLRAAFRSLFNPPTDRQADVEAPPPVIANKLSQASSPSRKRQDSSLAGAKLVKSLLLEASPSQTSEHEIRPSRPSPPPPSTKSAATPKPTTPPTTPPPPTSTPGFKSYSLTPPPTATSSSKPSSAMGHGGWMQRGRRGRGRRGWIWMGECTW